jgi:phosphate transport system substrate-binding protein
MNDDFLHRLRKAPPPGFLTGLKARLDRQQKLPPPRRSGFGRGLIVGFLVAGVAFAVTSLSLTGLPTSAGLFFSAPVQFVARLFDGRGDSEANGPPVKAVPLAPWMTAPVNTQPASARVIEPPPSEDSAAYIGPIASSAAPRAEPSGKATQSLATISVGVDRPLYSFALASVSGHSRSVEIKVNEQPPGNVFQGVCGTATAINGPDIIETTHRATADQNCMKVSHSNNLVEVKVGYQAVVLTRSKLYGPLNLSARDVFLALARRVPNPSKPTELIDNPYSTWNQVDPALPYDAISVYGPAQNSPAGRLAAELLLDAGCNTLPMLRALRERDAAAFEATCHRLRTDRAYMETTLEGDNYADTLAVAPTAVGITTLPASRSLRDKLVVNPIDGITPDSTTFAAQSYPASRTIYLYTNVYRFGPSYWVDNIIQNMMNPHWPDPVTGASLWGFVNLDDAESAAVRADYKALKTVQFGPWQ